MDENSDSETRPVGLLRPNAWGLYDMSGNVWEWVWDWGIDRYEEGSVTDPLGPTDGSVRVYRGGSWFNSAAYARVAYRSDGGPAFRFNALGFRLARTIP
jgi:formylglycine-generating enzyme required for sulfatase activity